MEFFYDKKCNIYSVAEVKVQSSYEPVTTLIHSMIKCDFWKKTRENAKDTDIARNTIDQSYILDLQGNILDVHKKYLVDIYNVISGTSVLIGTYIVAEEPMIYPDLNGIVDNVEIEIKQRTV